MSQDDDVKDQTSEPVDDYNFLDEMRDLFAIDPDEAVSRLEEAGYTEEDLQL